MNAQINLDITQKVEQLFSERFDLNGNIGRCYKSVKEIPSGALQKITQEQSFWCSSEWLTYVEQIPEVQMLYLVIEDCKGNLAGILPCQLVTHANGLLFYNIPRSLIKGGNFGNPDFLTPSQQEELKESQNEIQCQNLYPSLIAATPNSYCALMVSPSISTNERQKIISAMVKFFECCAYQLGSRVHGLFYLPEDLSTDMARNLPDKYQKVRVGADTILSVRWKSFEEYLKFFNDHRRNTIRRERKKFMNAGLDVKVLCGAEGLTDELIELQLSIRSKYGHGGDLNQLRNSFIAMRENLADRIRVFTAVCKGETLGFVLFFEYDNVLYSHVAGFDYEKLDKVFCYPNICFYEPLIYAIKQGITRIHYGLSSYEGKVRRGCELFDLGAYITLDTEYDDSLLKHIVNLMSYSEEQQLNYFRKMVVQSLKDY